MTFTPIARAEGSEHARHLCREFAGGHEHEAAGAAGLRRGAGQSRDHHEAEGEGLARTGAGTAGDVTALESGGNGAGLDRCGLDQLG